MNTFIHFMERRFIPVANKISSNRYLKSISTGSMALLGVIMLGSIFTVITSFSWEPYQSFLTTTHIGTVLNYIPDFTIDLLGLYMAFSIAYCGASIFDIEDQALGTGIISLVSFLLLSPITVNAKSQTSFLNVTYLGAKGVFVAIIVSLITIQLMKFFVKKNFTIKMPAGVPEMVTKSFTSLIPAVVIAALFGIVKYLFSITSFKTATDFIYTLLQEPLQSLTGTLPAFLILILISNLLWFFGIHGSMTVLPILMPIFLGYLASNTTAVAAGKAVPHVINFGLYDLACLGGSGATIGLVTCMFFFSKSKRYKAFSKIVFPSGLFGVNEPVIFGMPVMLNVMLLIPFLLTPLVIVTLGYVLISLGVITAPIGILGAGSLPPLVHGIVQGSLSFGIYELFATAISMLIYFPFFKALDNQAVQEEREAAEKDVSKDQN
ncbi:PTS sugar transporter subunit IIC [Lactiplantibacillus plantarum]|uniref:PTS sugar transporter subunit IIC n=1 Tax=Lactiplantibacillus plantarum TaxID=1590 RepID=UPI001363826D|nr:PTS transporter subunit EIIC [Lactiplantibacillus plantarum]MCB7177508.1 PTS transporter subunit EIIC [Lactiplantibacillus plantarum]QHM32636.1 Lichenan permease IIC component [Lactiplantibacillus plantarum]